MGLFKNIKDMKAMVSAAPGLIESAQQLGAAAQAQRLDSSAAIMMPTGGQGMVNAVNALEHGEPSAAALAPIAGVDLDTYVTVVKGIAAFGFDQGRLPEIAASHGIAPHDWHNAQAGWGDRIKADRALGARFNQLYTEA